MVNMRFIMWRKHISLRSLINTIGWGVLSFVTGNDIDIIMLSELDPKYEILF